MIELEIYAAGVRNLDKILALDLEFEAVPGLRYKVDSNHDIVYLELEEASIHVTELQSVFKKLGLAPQVVGAVHPSLDSAHRNARLLV